LTGFGVEGGKADFRESLGRKSRLFPKEIPHETTRRRRDRRCCAPLPARLPGCLRTRRIGIQDGRAWRSASLLSVNSWCASRTCRPSSGCHVVCRPPEPLSWYVTGRPPDGLRSGLPATKLQATCIVSFHALGPMAQFHLFGSTYGVCSGSSSVGSAASG
jgi:hypothetical protein